MTKFPKDTLPLLPLRDIVVFPYMIVPLLIGRKASLAAVDAAMKKDQFIFLCAQKNFKLEDPGTEDIYNIGTIAKISQLVKLPDGSIKILAEGISRGEITKFIDEKEFLKVQVNPLFSESKKTLEIEALMRGVKNHFEEYVKLNTKIPPDIITSINMIENQDELADGVASYMALKITGKQILLEIISPVKRLKALARLLNEEIGILLVEKKIMGDVRKTIEKSQRDYYLSEQMKAIEKELGEKAGSNLEADEIRKKIFKARMPKEARQVALNELKRYSRMMPSSAEAAVVRNYLDWMVSLPWSVKTSDNLDIENAKKILDEDHFGLEKPKERILEYLAVRKLSASMKGPILCFVGPPGVGKTSLAKSVARALGRKFVRISLGGVRDEAEIRGHRRTYVGAMPGRVIQSMKKAKTKNPVFLLDEVDKMSVDFRGDPSAALLEVLDPEQNHSFSDHYLEVDFNLSDCLFITTSNVQYNIPVPLQDRMEIIKLPGYTEYEKLEIARRFLLPKQIIENGLNKKQLTIQPDVLESIIKRYTKEAGVRELERKIAGVARKVARAVVDKKNKNYFAAVKNKTLHKFLGPPQYSLTIKETGREIGLATGLAWTEVGGDIINVEASLVEGKGSLILTGKLGEVMRESAQAALTYIRSRAKLLGIKNGFYKNKDMHVHVPEGAIPKDGPSAGITMATAMVSSLIGKPARNDVAMTGEITLRGRVLPVGGIKSKLLAAHRSGIKTVIVPKENEKDLVDIPKDIRKDLNLVMVKNIDEVLKVALKRSKQ